MRFLGAVDQGTSSTRFILYDENGKIVGSKQQVFDTMYPQPGWAEQDPMLIVETVRACIAGVIAQTGVDARDVKAIGVTNQRETTVVWDRASGRPLHNALVWLDTRTAAVCAELTAAHGGDRDCWRPVTGLPISTYFTAPKLLWLMRNVPAVARAVAERSCLVGTIDSWLVWNLTGGRVHVTDVTNASRTMLMELATCRWHEPTLHELGIPLEILPRIASSSEIYGSVADGPLAGVSLAGILGDQQAALVGQGCLVRGSAKATYGTGAFLLYNTGRQLVQSRHGLLSTVAFQFGPDRPVHYALEGSIAIAGAGVKWLRDNLGLVRDADEFESLAASVPDASGVYFVPALSGLFAPYWQEDARGMIGGLTQHSDRRHVCRALLDAIAMQTKEILDGMQQDAGAGLSSLKVDGGMARNTLLCQIQADLLRLTVVRAESLEATAFGAAYAAGVATGVFPGDDDAFFASLVATTKPTLFESRLSEADVAKLFNFWRQAIERTVLIPREYV